MDFGITGIAAIAVLCMLIGEVAKKSNLNNKWIPSICGLSGLILGIVGLRVMPDFPANDIITAAAIGVVSGFGSTGINQAYKQLTDLE